MRALDRFLQNVRIAKARRFIQPEAIVIDVGCADGALFERCTALVAEGFGVDPIIEGRIDGPGYTLYGGSFPDALPELEADVITMLAVLEHMPVAAQGELASACADRLRPGGRVVITVPSPKVDAILAVLQKLRVIDGMSLEEHHGFEAETTPDLFPPPRYRLLTHETFQLGLNNLFVFEKVGAP
jgi:2-polyprenyl-3-methyl-5-hydroxy-6-metoxy-1,4-benzoquinol methylase